MSAIFDTSVGYKPSPWGTIFHNIKNPDGSQINELLGAGAAGPGKTEVLIHDPLPQIFIEHQRCADPKHPHHLDWGMSQGWALFLRREARQLNDVLTRAKKLITRLDPGATWNGQNNTYTMSSGYRWTFDGLKDPDDWVKFQGFQFTWIGYDELVEFEEKQYTMVNTRLRTTDPVLRKMMKIRACSNPVLTTTDNERITVSNPFWVRDYFVKPHRDGKKIINRKVRMRDGSTRWHTRLYLPATLYDNPNKEYVEDYEFNLRTKPKHVQRALIYGDWWITEGSFFGEEWNERLHVCRPFKIPKSWLRFRSMDWGYKRPGVVLWWALDPDGTLWCEREYTFREMLDVEVAKTTVEYEKKDGLSIGSRSLITGPADDQLWEKRGDDPLSKADRMLQNGVSWFPADKRSRATNALRVMERLKDHNDGTTTPGIVFFDTCVQTIQTLPAIQTDPKNPECPMDGGEDHWYDAVAYACAATSKGFSGSSVNDLEDRAEQASQMTEAEDAARGSWGYG